MLEHALWSPGHLTVRTIRDRREGHVVVVDRDGVRVAEGDDEGAIRATSGLVLAEAPVALPERTGPDPTVGGTSHRAGARRPGGPGRRAAGSPTGSRVIGGARAGASPRSAGRPAPRSASTAPLWAGSRDDEPGGPPAATDGRGAVPTDAEGGHPALIVDVFGERRGEVRVRSADESWRRRTLEADLLVDGLVVARLRTVGPWAEEAVVVAGAGGELARLARFDHLRGVVRTVSAWDLSVAEIPDERLRAVTIAAVLRLAKLRASAAEPSDPRRGPARWLRPGRPA